jgi:glutaredoxin
MTFIIYTKSGCENCDKAKKLLEKEETVIFNCDQMLKNNRAEFIKSMELKIRRPFKTFPVIFIDDDYLGGYEDLASHLIFDVNEEF